MHFEGQTIGARKDTQINPLHYEPHQLSLFCEITVESTQQNIQETITLYTVTGAFFLEPTLTYSTDIHVAHPLITGTHSLIALLALKSVYYCYYISEMIHASILSYWRANGLYIFLSFYTYR